MRLNIRQLSSSSFFILLSIGLIGFAALNCSAQYPANENVALENLRRLTAKGKLPSESVVANIERRYPNSRIGALARLLRARIKLENGDPRGAASLLQTGEVGKRTRLGDYSDWLLGKSLDMSGDSIAANKVFADFVKRYPNSTRFEEAKYMWAENLIETGKYEQAIQVLKPLVDQKNGRAFLMTADAYEKQGVSEMTVKFNRMAYFYSAASSSGRKAKKRLEDNNVPLTPFQPEEALARAEDLFKSKSYRDATKAYDEFARLGGKFDDATRLNQVAAAARAGNRVSAESAFRRIPTGSKVKPEAYYEFIRGIARGNDWTKAQTELNNFRRVFPKSEWVPRTIVELGDIAGSKRRSSDKRYFMQTALSMYPNAIENTKAHFEIAWSEHEKKNFQQSSKLLTEHLARYVDKDNSYRGKSGYWAARDSERAGKTAEACALYDATAYRYGANWYGYQALQRVSIMRRQGKCQTKSNFAPNSLVGKAVRNLKVVTVAAETATSKELELAAKSEELSTIGLFDWAIEELNVAKKTANNSPKINLALAKHYRLKGNNVRALLALKPSYPDYSQMFPEEMGPDEWDIFYPLTHWSDIKYWASRRKLDPYNVAGLIRQETIFDSNARSRANAYGLMQLLVPTARLVARKHNSSLGRITGSRLYDPKLNIELGTAYMRDQLDRFGRIEYMSVAYNAGPGRAVSWRRTLPLQMDEFVEKIPFRETQGYVKGIIRNSAQYRRLYDLNGKFKANVGTKPLRAQIDQTPEAEFSAKNPEVKVDRIKRAAE